MSLFGASTQQQQQPSLFGNSLGANTQNKPSLFGSSTTQNNQQPSASLFGNLNQNNQAQTQQNTTLFGNNQQQQQQQQQTNTGLFGQSQNQQNAAPSQGANFFGGSALGASLLNNSTAQPPQALQQSQIAARLAETLKPRERSIPEQMELLLRRWSPEDPSCQMQTYFYNSVPAGTAPFWSPSPGEDETKWEEALAKKPSENSVPVLARGFQQLGVRLRMQVQAVGQLQQRLHEMNNSLEAMMQNHELTLSVRAAEAKRRHIGLSQKCLGLAIKVQILRSRGFVMDGAEEELRRKLEGLERTVFDPGFAGREEEIWARMVALRERTGWLQRESEKLGRQVESGEKAGLSEEVLAKVKRILSDYDVQISHLKKELDLVTKDFEGWQSGGPAR